MKVIREYLFPHLFSSKLTINDYTYPSAPGAKEKGGPSEQAAAAVQQKAVSAKFKIVELLRENPSGFTADELADRIGHSILFTRPRVSELKAEGAIAKSGNHRKNSTGMSANVWVAI